MEELKQLVDRTIILQKSLLFLHTADEDKNYGEELELSSLKNSSLHNPSIPFTISLPIIILGLIGNGIIFWLLSCTIKKTKFTVYIANMAVGDFLALQTVFFVILEFFTPLFINTHAGQLLLISFFFGHETKSYFLAAITVERCLTVFSPVWYQSHRPKCSTTLLCAFIWTVTVILSLLEHFLCTQNQILTIGTFPCQVSDTFTFIITFIILIPCMVFSTLALFIRMKRKPQQDLPARLDISILVTVVLQVIFSPATEIIDWISTSKVAYANEFYYVSLILYCLGSSVNPFVYLLVGCWKREKGQEPFYMFLERALKDERKGTMRTEADQEQA